MSINTILWPTDLSTQSRKAAAQVASLANKYGAKVIVMYTALDLCSYFPPTATIPAGTS
ncbi:universal stress protein [Salidesulfovibrio brasiliensis]|uniref:universal stress protein n=1 Tax=Salidesulfovibrio brasiliensis TaxID=221711 RepID=UPI000AE1FE25|nr:universal stress protein [Salidesulfovibrio brasiliensis]